MIARALPVLLGSEAKDLRQASSQNRTASSLSKTSAASLRSCASTVRNQPEWETLDCRSVPASLKWLHRSASLGIGQRIEVRSCQTFNSGVTPVHGERKAEPKVLAP